MIWNKEAESASRPDLENSQLSSLQQTVKLVSERVPFYQKRLAEAGVSADSIRSLDDLDKIPFMTKDDLRLNYPFGLLTTGLDQILRLHASSGTTGQPTVVGYTASDIQLWAEVMARTMTAAGTTSSDVVQNAYGYGLFTGGLGIHYGAERVGATVVPISGGNTMRQVRIMIDFGTTVLACTPSYALHIAEVSAEMGIDPHDCLVKAGVFGAEPWSEGMRREIEDKLGLLALDIYGLSEVIGPGVAFECPEKQGLHINEDHFLPEIIDPETGKRLPAGQKGELVFTSLTKVAMPVLRYRTRDISALQYGACACGRTLVRMDRITGRTDDMLIIRGVNVFPSQIETVLMEVDGMQPYYQLVVDRHGTMDMLEVQVEVDEQVVGQSHGGSDKFEDTLRKQLESILGISLSTRIVPPKSIPRSEGKAKRVIDNRKM